jgi:outer membrane protein assembly factor BamB
MDGKGDVSKTHVAWRTTLATSSFASPIIDRGIVYLVNRTGMLQALSLETGKQLWKERLPCLDLGFSNLRWLTISISFAKTVNQ